MNDHNPTRSRPVRDSKSEMTEIVLPNDANPLNALLGGRLMHWIDMAAAMAAHRHSRQYVVTASIDHLDFLVPVRVGDIVHLLAPTEIVGKSGFQYVHGSRSQSLGGELPHREQPARQLGILDVRRGGRYWPPPPRCARNS